MSADSERRIVERVDRAFELLITLIVIITGVVDKYLPTAIEDPQQAANLPSVIANLKGFSLVFFLPLIGTIGAWILVYFTDDETLKMQLRVFCWGSVIFSAILGIVEYYALFCAFLVPLWLHVLLGLFVIFSCLLIPIIPLLILRKIVHRYRVGLSNVDFFKGEGRTATAKRYAPFLVSYVIFWIAYNVATLA